MSAIIDRVIESFHSAARMRESELSPPQRHVWTHKPMSSPDEPVPGDEAALEITPLIYKELRKLAATYLRNEREGHTLQPTALVHEAAPIDAVSERHRFER
jgi:hypothetical protein